MAEHGEVLRTYLGLCPRCGTEAQLDEYTGWCENCIPDGTCVVCRQPSKTRVCHRCIDSRFATRYADEIADYREAGLSILEAKRRVRNDIRPICLSCGERIHRGRSAAFLCGQPKCRKVYNRYSKNVYVRKMPRDVALKEALERYDTNTEVQ